MKLIPYWMDTARPAEDYRREELPDEVDIAIIGGGFTGLSAALFAARGGARVALFERDSFGWGASGRNGGMATTGLAISFGKAVKRYGPERAAAMFLAYNDAIDTIEQVVADEGLDCGFERVGKLNLACKPAHYEGYQRSAELMARYADHQVTMIPPESIRQEIGSDYYVGGMVDPLGAALHVGEFVYGLAAAASSHGASMHESCPVLDVRPQGPRHRIDTLRGQVVADHVVMATGALTGDLMPWLRRRVVPIGSFIIATEPLDETLARELLPHRRVASDSKHLLYYFRLTPDNRMLFGGRARFAISSPHADLRSGQILREGMLDVFPQLEDARIDYCWGGLVDMSLDQMVHAGQTHGIHYSAGYSGHGVQMATHMGKQLAHQLLGRPAENPWAELSFPAVPGHFGPPWFLPPVGVYYKLLDRIS